MTLLDLLLALIVGGSVVAGIRTGFTRTAFGIIATIVGVILGFWFYHVPAPWFTGMVGKTAANLFGFFTVFAVVMVISIIGRIISKAFKVIGLGILDRLGGAAFGLVRGAFVAAAAVAVLLAATPRPVPSWMQGSVLLPYAIGTSDLISALAPRALKDGMADSVKEIRKTWNDELEKAKRHAQESFTPAPPPVEEKKLEVIPPPAKAKVKKKALKK
jgi:membrane protein required for colicin V production